MKAGWEVKPLGKVAKLHYGKALAKAERNPEGGVPVYGANGILGWSDHILTEGPSLIVGRKGSAGEINRVDGPFWPSDVTYYTEHDASKLDFSFFHYGMLTLDIPSLAKGVKPGINRNEAYALEIPIPPLEEQKRIVAVLDAAFEGLTRATEHAKANLQNARELFEAALVKVFSVIEAESDQKLLKQIALDFGRGKSKHRPRNAPFLYGGPYPFVQTGDVRNSGHLITKYKQTYTDAGLAQSKLWPANTLCITIAANIAETAILSFEACFPDSIIGVVPDPELTSSRYLEYLLQFFQKRLKARGEGAAQHNINLATFETEYFPFPSLAKQELAIEALDRAYSAVQLAEANYRTQLTDIADLRQSLLQKAFAGELT